MSKEFIGFAKVMVLFYLIVIFAVIWLSKLIHNMVWGV
ncbi:AB1gp48 [Acinetobacter phage AB1]|uniref:AB1gp48 n=1 Tax=Acinetobacter phage AB1 TaxID=889876 RepID=E2GLY6_9CAUD|nr:AB1gp48 [Acinetobacter phage AB1]ADO14419.1 AB1gp48 [Acinetobacter phage AB1]